MQDFMQTLAGFSAGIEFEDLPAAVVHETKRMLLDSIGVAMAAQAIEKGRLCTLLSQRLGGPAEATILGAPGKVSASNAALANGELINALDYDALFIPGGHVAPYIVPSILALAEARDASGRDLLLALALGTEVAMRITRGMSPMVRTVPEGPERQSYRWTDPYGGTRYNIGAAAGLGRLLGFDADRMAHAIGLAGHHTQVPTHSKMSYSLPVPMSKYGTPGWQSTGAIVGALLAELGYAGDTTLFEGDSGFWRISSSEEWMPEKVLAGLKEDWALLEQQYKPYPSCRVVHTGLDLFYRMLDQHGWAPERIEKMVVQGSAYCEKPHLQNKNIRNAMDAQFSAAYSMAMAAHRIPIGVEWQESAAMTSPSVIDFMQRVSCEVHPAYTRQPLADRLMILGRIEVTVDGRRYVDEASFASGTPRPGFALSDAQLRGKFVHNAARVLDPARLDQAADALFQLERLPRVGDLMRLMAP